MSSIGSDSGEDEYVPGNQPDGSYYNLFPQSSQPGLLGGQYADMQANAPSAGMTGLDAVALGLDDTGLPPPVTVAPELPQRVDSLGSRSGASFNPYDWVHDVLNTPAGSKGLEVTQGLARSFEDAGNKAAVVGLGGAGIGALTLDPAVVLGSLGLAGLGAGFGGFGEAGDAVTSFLKSIQQDNGKPLNDFGIRAATPDVTDLVPDRK